MVSKREREKRKERGRERKGKSRERNEGAEDPVGCVVFCGAAD